MTDPIVIPIAPTFMAIIVAKLYFWTRRSLPRYLLASFLIALGSSLFSTFPGNEVVVMRFFAVAVVTIAVSLATVAISAKLLARRFGGVALRISFSEDGILGTDAIGRSQMFPWAILGLGIESQRRIIIPDYGVIRSLLGTGLIGRRAALILEKAMLDRLGITDALRALLKARGKLR